MSFKQAVLSQLTTTENGMPAYKQTGSKCVDLFFKIGASRGQDIIPHFVAAWVENRELALRIAQWARDIRGGAGERQIFKDILKFLNAVDAPELESLIKKTPELGRWDDLLVLEHPQADKLIITALQRGDKLCAKWMPRQGPHAERLRKQLKLTPKGWRKLVVGLTNVVEQQMCAKRWDEINFEQVPSLAHSRYRTAFARNAQLAYPDYISRLKAGKAKVNVGAVYPYDVLKGVHAFSYSTRRDEQELIVAQWNALPNYIGSANILPLVDVSGSMMVSVSGGTSAMDVAVSLGLYCADKNTGPFNGCFLTFSERPELLYLQGSIIQKAQQMVKSRWGMNTNISLAFDKILETAVAGKVSQAEMPEILLILSDMQFDGCVNGYSAFEALERKYQEAGYQMPKVVFWNLAAKDNVPVRFDQHGTAMVSGFSPQLLKSILAVKNFTPEGIMLRTVMIPRYDL